MYVRNALKPFFFLPVHRCIWAMLWKIELVRAIRAKPETKNHEKNTHRSFLSVANNNASFGKEWKHPNTQCYGFMIARVANWPYTDGLWLMSRFSNRIVLKLRAVLLLSLVHSVMYSLKINPNINKNDRMANDKLICRPIKISMKRQLFLHLCVEFLVLLPFTTAYFIPYAYKCHAWSNKTAKSLLCFSRHQWSTYTTTRIRIFCHCCWLLLLLFAAYILCHCKNTSKHENLFFTPHTSVDMIKVGCRKKINKKDGCSVVCLQKGYFYLAIYRRWVLTFKFVWTIDYV